MADAEDFSDIKSLLSGILDAINEVAKNSKGKGPAGGPGDPSPSDGEINKIKANLRKDLATFRRNTEDLSSIVGQVKSPIAKLIFDISQTSSKYGLKIKAQDDLIKQYEDEGRATEQKVEELKRSNLAYMRASEITSIVTKNLQNLSKQINTLVKIVRDTQQQFGITAGDAAKLRFDNLVQSVDSFITTLKTAGKTVPVTAEQIRRAQQDFRAQFGGIIDENSARELAEQAVRMGLTTQQLAEARRVFATQTMGDISSAIQQQDRFIAQFEARGMTAKDAMEFIGSNSELLARSGVRFQQSMAKAAAEAKRIGVDLSKVNQVGDNIIGNFEGFLDSMAELGAMGFGFDTFRLAQVAETGDTGALFNELRSQLAMTGKDLTNLRRSEQLALSSAFGMNIEEFQRMAGILEEPVEQKLQEEANGYLSTIATKISEFLGKFGEQGANLAQAFGVSMEFLAKAAGWALQRWFLLGIWRNTGKMAAALSGGGLLGVAGGGGVTGPGGVPIPSPGSTGTSGGTPGGPSMLERFFGNVKPSQLLAAGAAMIMVAGATFILAKAFQEFGDVEWPDVAKGILALSVLAGVTAVMGKGIKFIALGAAAITVLSASLWIFGKALEAIAGPFATFGNTIKEMDGINFLGIAGGIYAITTAMAGLAAGGFTKNITDFISGGDPLKKLNDRLVDLSKNTDGVNTFSNSINNLVISLASLSEVVERLDINKLNSIMPQSIPEKITSGVMGLARNVFGISSTTTPAAAVTNDVPSAANVTGTLVSGTASNSNVTNMEINELKQKLDDVIKTINNLNQLPRALAETIGSMEVNMDGIKVGQVLSTSEGRALTDAVHRRQRL